MAFGALGGLGGMGASFPMRYGAPNSQQVQTLDELTRPIWDEYNAQQQAMREAQQAAQQSLNAAWGGWGDERGLDPSTMGNIRGITTNAAQAGVKQGNLGHVSAAFAPADNAQALAQQYMKAFGNAGPDFAEFQARHDEIANPFLENQAIQQQGYDQMRGWGQVDAVPGPGYSAPGFGQITGAQNPYAVTNPQNINMDWARGFYDPQQTQQQAGVYNPQQQTGQHFWGL